MPERKRDTMAANRSEAQSYPAAPPSAVQPCVIAVKYLRAAVFFDGTNNNRFRDEGFSAETNIARLYQLFVNDDDAETIRRKQYIVGVGAEDVTKLKREIDEAKVKLKAEDDVFFKRVAVDIAGAAVYWGQLAGNIAGQAGGLGGKDRLNSAYAWLQAECDRLLPNVEKTVDVYGFSRGAALARTFVNLVNQGLRPHVQNVQVRFVGIFDTVGSFGIAGSDLNPGQNLSIDSGDAQQIFHCCARNEYRSNFPLSSVPGRDRYYMGAHSDVGGGYPPEENGTLNHLAFIPLVDTHLASIDAGVELKPWQPQAAKAGVDVDKLRQAVATFDPNTPAMYDPQGPYAKHQKIFLDRYVHLSASQSRFNKLNPDHPEWSGTRTVLVPSKKRLVGDPPDFDWQ
jgi:hypothetical protein